MDCATLPFNCKMQPKCSPVNKIDQTILDSFFTTSTTCNTTYVYLSSRGEGESRDIVKVKQIPGEDCNILFTSKRGYYYVYSFLLQQIIIWAKDPRAFARQGYLGHHTTIGIKNGRLDIHDTFYNAFKNVRNYLILARTKTQIDYMVDYSKNELIKLSRGKSFFEEANQTLWNDILCHQKDIEVSGKSRDRTHEKTNVKLMNPLYLPKSNTSKLEIKEIAQVINSRIVEARQHLASGKYKLGAISVPYISKLVEKRVLKHVEIDQEHQYILFSCHEPDTRCSVICVNMWM